MTRLRVTPKALVLLAGALALSGCVVRPGYGYRRGYYGPGYYNGGYYRGGYNRGGYYAPRGGYYAPRPGYVPPPAPAYRY